MYCVLDGEGTCSLQLLGCAADQLQSRNGLLPQIFPRSTASAPQPPQQGGTYRLPCKASLYEGSAHALDLPAKSGLKLRLFCSCHRSCLFLKLQF